MQSPSSTQVSPSSHVAPHEPPQSTSVSSPSCMSFAQVGSTQMSAMSSHVIETQSSPSMQPSPTSQSSGHEPPQSTSVSSPFCMSSLQSPPLSVSVSLSVSVALSV